MKMTGHKTDSVFRRSDIVSPDDLRIARSRSSAGRQLDAAMPSDRH
jgi:hypothetical protein